MPSVNSTRLRRSGIRKIFANFSSMSGFSASGETARVTYQFSVCANEAACRRICAGTLKFDLVRLESSLAVFPDTDLMAFGPLTQGEIEVPKLLPELLPQSPCHRPFRSSRPPTWRTCVHGW